MKTRNFANLGNGTAAAINSGTIGVQKDKIVHLDPNAEILYDPEENIRNGQLIDDSIEGLVELRQTLDEEQLQPIRVYPLPPHKLDPAKPAMKYGIGFGHRRTLACRLTSDDSPLITGKARKVSAVIDVDWLKKGRSYRLRCQIRENTARVDLNPVELGQALRDYQRELGEEEKRHVSQAELMDVYGLKEKTVYNLLKAADLHQIARDVCHRQLLNDLDTMITFDVICKANEPLAQAIYESLQKEGAPSNRSLIRQARILAEDKEYVFDAQSFEWPGSVEKVGVKPPTAVQVDPVVPESAGQGASPALHPSPEHPANEPLSNGGSASGAGQEKPSDQMPDNGGSGANTVPVNLAATQNPVVPPAQEAGQGGQAPEKLNGVAGSPPSDQLASPQVAPATLEPVAGKAPVIVVEFKMGAEASATFTGELLVGRKAKGASNGVVAYLNEGREEQTEVPLKYIHLVSINHL